MPVEWLTTSTILRDLCESDGRAWRLLVERFRSPIVHFARQAGLSPVEAEDAAQETLAAFVQAFREGRYQRERGRLSQWLFGIAWRLVQRQRRLVARQPILLSGSDDGARFWAELPDDQSAVVEWDEQWERSLLEACITRVREEVEPETFRAFEAVTQSDQPAAVIAGRLGMPVKAVYNAKHRVLKRLRELKDELEQTDAQFGADSARR